MWARSPRTVPPPQAAPPRRAQFAFWHPLSTAGTQTSAASAISSLCCQWFEDAIDALLQQQDEFVARQLQAVSFEINCRLRRLQDFSAAAADSLTVGLRITDLAASTARFELAIFHAMDDKPIASGHVVRIFIDPLTSKPAQLSAALQQSLAACRR